MMAEQCSLFKCMNWSHCRAQELFPQNGTWVDYSIVDYFHIGLGLVSLACSLLVFISYWRIKRIRSSSQLPILAR